MELITLPKSGTFHLALTPHVSCTNSIWKSDQVYNKSSDGVFDKGAKVDAFDFIELVDRHFNSVLECFGSISFYSLTFKGIHGENI